MDFCLGFWNFGELDDETVPGLGAVLSDLLEDGNEQDQEAFMDPADIETVFNLEVEPVPMSSDPYDHPTMPSLTNVTTFNKVPNVEIVSEQIPAPPGRQRLYGNATKPTAEPIPTDVLNDKLDLFKHMYDNSTDGESVIDLFVTASNIRMKKI